MDGLTPNCASFQLDEYVAPVPLTKGDTWDSCKRRRGSDPNDAGVRRIR